MTTCFFFVVISTEPIALNDKCKLEGCSNQALQVRNLDLSVEWFKMPVQYLPKCGWHVFSIFFFPWKSSIYQSWSIMNFCRHRCRPNFRAVHFTPKERWQRKSYHGRWRLLGFEACRIGSNGSPVLLRAPKIQSQDMFFMESAMFCYHSINFRVYRYVWFIGIVLAFFQEESEHFVVFEGYGAKHWHCYLGGAFRIFQIPEARCALSLDYWGMRTLYSVVLLLRSMAHVLRRKLPVGPMAAAGWDISLSWIPSDT